MEILLVTNSCSSLKYREILENRTRNILDPQQKYFRLLAEGLAAHKDVSVRIFSVLPLSASCYPQKIFKYSSEEENNVTYEYIPFLNGRILRYITLFLSSLYLIFRWCLRNRNKDSIVICDPLTMMAAVPCRFIAQCFGVKAVALITDIPSLVSSNKKIHGKFRQKISDFYDSFADGECYKYDSYITLTESINERLNITNKPYCIVEGLADSGDLQIQSEHDNYIMYAGGVYEIYGVKNLVEAFVKLGRSDLELHIYGSGTFVEDLKEVSKEYKNIQYKGCLPAEQIVEIEKNALLLVNPRPVAEDFSKYSFPSKTIEYLLSGTPLLSTKLPGIPKEYFDFIYAIDEDSVIGIYNGLNKVLMNSKKVLAARGKEGHEFIINKKNNVVMAEKVIELAKSII